MIYLVGMTQNEVDNIRELTDPIWEHIDGLIFVDHHSTDGTRELLEERKKFGIILDKIWVRDHSYSMNSILLEGGMTEGDWFIIRDSMERFNPEWAKDIEKFLMIESLSGVNSIYNYGKGFAFRYNEYMRFFGNPHWGLDGISHNIIDLKNRFSEEKKEHTWRIKDGEAGGRPYDNKINHEAKYGWCYGRSNHLLLGLEDNIDLYKRAEAIRMNHRAKAKYAGFDMTIEGLRSYFLSLEGKELEIFVNSHRVWSNFYRYHILETPFEEIERTENTWRLE